MDCPKTIYIIIQVKAMRSRRAISIKEESAVSLFVLINWGKRAVMNIIAFGFPIVTRIDSLNLAEAFSFPVFPSPAFPKGPPSSARSLYYIYDIGGAGIFYNAEEHADFDQDYAQAIIDRIA
jgi:hypothetical protein